METFKSSFYFEVLCSEILIGLVESLKEDLQLDCTLKSSFYFEVKCSEILIGAVESLKEDLQ